MLRTAKPFYRVLRTGLAAGVIATALGACGSTNWGFPYRPDIQQGNWITSEQVAKLQAGMTREQVRYILGTPTLQDIFHNDRWDYPYYNNPGYGKDEQRRFTVWFQGDTLLRWEGDQQPDRQPFQKADTGMQKAANGEKSPATAQPTITGGAPVGQDATPPAGDGQSNVIRNTVTPEAASSTPGAAPAEGTAGDVQGANAAQRAGMRRPLINNIENRPDTGAPSAAKDNSEPLR